MNYRIGPKQLVILRAIRDGAELWKSSVGDWTLDEKHVNRDRCMTLYFRGFLMEGMLNTLPSGKWRQRYELTDKGKAAL